MTTQSAEEKKKALIASMSEERGYLPKPWLYLAEHDTDFLAAYNDIYQRALGEGQSLSIKVRELVCTAILCFRGMEDAAAVHFKRARKHGATMHELLEAVETMFIPGGAPTMGAGLLALMKVIDEEQKAADTK